MIHFLHPDMRKPPGIRLTPRSFAQLAGGQRFERLSRRLAAALIGLVLAAAYPAGQTAAPAAPPAPEPQQAANVGIEFLADGRCHVSANGQGFKSDATYTPKAVAAPGELRCAMPPVPQGITVALTVVMPAGVSRPAASEPPLEWQASADGRWSGSGRLTEWPEVIVVRARRQTWTFWAPVAIAVMLGAIVLRRRRARRAGAA